MPRNKIPPYLLLALSLTLSAQEQHLDISSACAFGVEKEIETADISVSAKIRGTPCAYETYDIYAPFDGRIDEVRSELFDLVYPETIMAKAVTKDMAALLDTANTSDPQSKKQILKRWKGSFDYYDIKPKEPGIIVNVYVKPRDYVNEGDKLFTVARKMQIIAVNTEPIYSHLASMMRASMASVRDDGVKVDLYLKSFVPIKDKPFFYRLWMDIEELKDRIKIGETFEGSIFIGESKNAKLADRRDVIIKDGKRYLLMEIKPGLISADKLEILSPTKSFLPAQSRPAGIEPPQTEQKEQSKAVSDKIPALGKTAKKRVTTLQSKAKNSAKKGASTRAKTPAKASPKKEEYDTEQ